MKARRLPAEWEDQDGVLLSWPHEGTDWRPDLDVVQPVFAEMVREICLFERALIVAPDVGPVYESLQRAGVRSESVQIFAMETNDTWTRDYGPIVIREDEEPVLLDFGFNGWGLKFPACFDNQVTRRLHRAGAFGDIAIRTFGLVLEGGSIESDGHGTVLTTSACLLSPNRNPQLSRKDLEGQLGALFGADRFHWLENGSLSGDDTDGHVDTIARFAPNDTIVHVACDDPSDEHFEPLGAMVEELRGFRSRRGKPYRLVPLPWPGPKFDGDGCRLPATYANFLVIDGAVLVPTYRDEKDRAALEAVGGAFPGRRVVGIDCLPLILQHGSLHCATMQLPKGTLR